jgi:acetyl esterase
MPLDPRAKRFLELLAATNPHSPLDLTVHQRRKSLVSLAKFSGPAAEVAAVEEVSVPGPDGLIAVRVYTPVGESPAPLPALVYFHGGGLVAGSLDTHDGVSRALANVTGCKVFSVDYRLAPEHRFPAAVVDAYAATLHVACQARELGVDARRIVVCGDSAGATLAAVVCQMSVARRDLEIALQLLICPIMDYAGQTESRRVLAEGYLVDEDTLGHDLLHYLTPGSDPADPRVSPLRAGDFSGLPPALIHTAEFDPLRDEGREYADLLVEAGVETAYTCHPGMIHLFYALGAVIPYAREAYDLIGTEVRAALD